MLVLFEIYIRKLIIRIESWFWSFHEWYEWNNRRAHFCMAVRIGYSIFHSYPSWNDQNQLKFLTASDKIKPSLVTYLGFSAALYMHLLLFFTQYILRLLGTANMQFVNMILHLVIICDPCVDRQSHTYLIIACISDISVKSDLKVYFMDINTNFCHLYIFQSRQKRKEYSGLTLYWIWRSTGNTEISMWNLGIACYIIFSQAILLFIPYKQTYLEMLWRLWIIGLELLNNF